MDAEGAERPIAFRGRSWLHVAAGMADLPAAERMAVCRAWVGGGGVEVRVYRTWTPVGGGGPFRRELRTSCRL